MYIPFCVVLISLSDIRSMIIFITSVPQISIYNKNIVDFINSHVIDRLWNGEERKEREYNSRF